MEIRPFPVMARLVVGLLGHDLYEIYWWFALSLTVALLNMNERAKQRTAQFTMTPTERLQ